MAIALHRQIMQAISPICTREVSGDVIGMASASSPGSP
jgi:hypothetical protein